MTPHPASNHSASRGAQRRISLGVLAGLVALAATGCGGEQATAPATSAPPPATVTTAPSVTVSATPTPTATTTTATAAPARATGECGGLTAAELTKIFGPDLTQPYLTATGLAPGANPSATAAADFEKTMERGRSDDGKGVFLMGPDRQVHGFGDSFQRGFFLVPPTGGSSECHITTPMQGSINVVSKPVAEWYKQAITSQPELKADWLETHDAPPGGVMNIPDSQGTLPEYWQSSAAVGAKPAPGVPKPLSADGFGAFLQDAVSKAGTMKPGCSAWQAAADATGGPIATLGYWQSRVSGPSKGGMVQGMVQRCAGNTVSVMSYSALVLDNPDASLGYKEPRAAMDMAGTVVTAALAQ